MLIGQTVAIDKAIDNLVELESQQGMFRRANSPCGHIDAKIAEINAKLLKMDDIYKMPASPADVEKLAKLFNANFIIGAGLDRSQVIGVAPDRTAFNCVARGLVDENTSYYFLLDIYIPREQSASHLQGKLYDWTTKYGWVDKVAVEQYQSMDFYNWCLERGYEAELIQPTAKNQEMIFKKMYEIIRSGYFKSPSVPYYTDEDGNLYDGYTNKDDILREELAVFTYQERGATKWWGAPDKKLKGAVKDDVMYSLAYAIHATQGESINDIHLRNKEQAMTTIYHNTDVVGDYSS